MFWTCSARALLTAGALWSGAVAHAQSTTATRVDPAALMASVQTLASRDFAGRGAGTEGGDKARAWVAAQFAAIGLTPVAGQVEQPFNLPAASSTPSTSSAPTPTPPATSGRGANLLGLCAGTAAGLPNIVISAHYDHLGVRGEAVYYGADDNASGVATLLEIAKDCVRQPFRHPLLFVAFDAEERGLRGSRAFVTTPVVPLDRIVLDVNLDMVARGDHGELYAAGTRLWPRTRSVLTAVAKQAPIKLLLGHDTPGSGRDDWTLQSDHGSFHQAGIPFVYFGVEDHPDYHQPTDTVDRIDATFFANAATTILDAVRALDALDRFK